MRRLAILLFLSALPAVEPPAVRAQPAPEIVEAASEAPIRLRVSVSRRRLEVLKGDAVLHRFPVGVGTGEVLPRPGGGTWDFSTPTGDYTIARRVREPKWYAPDWHYVERGLPVPPAGAPERYLPGALGAAMLVLDAGEREIDGDIAIHGTRDRASVGRASTHGCLRLADEAVLAVFDLVAIGTPVEIVP